ncbi:hypothetical protein [Bradyrhizobium sp. USDA 3364]
MPNDNTQGFVPCFIATDFVTAAGARIATLHFVRSLLDLFAGPDHGLGVAVYGVGTAHERIEIIRGGRLPTQLRAGLPRARAYWEGRSRRGSSISWDDAPVVWHESQSGWGPRFAIPGVSALIDLVAERRVLLEGSRP